MCGEWEFGGLPAWLYENGTIPIRTDAEPYISVAQHYWETQLLPQVRLNYDQREAIPMSGSGMIMACDNFHLIGEIRLAIMKPRLLIILVVLGREKSWVQVTDTVCSL